MLIYDLCQISMQKDRHRLLLLRCVHHLQVPARIMEVNGYKPKVAVPPEPEGGSVELGDNPDQTKNKSQ